MSLLSIVFFSCSEDATDQSTGREKGRTLSFDMTRTPQSIVDNTQIYIFENPTWKYDKPAFDVTSANNKLSMRVEAGTWNIAFVTADTPVSSSIKSPVRDEVRAGKMWETQAVAGELPSVPELRTAYLTGQEVIANQQNYGNETVMLYRNVAQVKVVIDKTRGLDVNGMHHFKLHDVPTTLNWAGGLYPSKTNPVVGSDPMKGAFTIREKQGEPGIQESDTLRFIIPAHRGSDFLGAHNDTTTHHLKLSVDLACLGGVRYEKTDVEIPRVPRMNGILVVRLSMVGELEVTAEVLDWVDVNLNASLSQTQLLIDKSEVGLAYRDTLYVNTNATNFTVAKDPAADWITSVQKIGNNGVEITANVDTYVDNQPRSSYITVTANNVVKKIPVTQRPDRGTISVDADKLFMSPPNPTKFLNVTSIGGDWKIIGTTLKANPSVNQGNTGSMPVSFTRTTTPDEAQFSTVYGDTIVVFKNTTTLDTDTVRLGNLYIHIEDELIEVAQPIVNSDTLCYVDNVLVYGGDYRSLNVYQRPSWIYPSPHTYYDTSSDRFYFRCDREPNGEERTDLITLEHIDDPDYRVTVRILQDIIVEIPEFDFYSVTFTWVNNDVDIKCGFTGNSGVYTFFGGSTSYVNVPFDSMYVGWNQGNTSVNYNSALLIQWGGDETGGLGETFFFNAPVINAFPYPGQYGVASSALNLLPRKLNLSIAAGWYTTSRAGSNITCTVAAYRGGTYVQVVKRYEFTGEEVYFDQRTYAVYEKAGSSQYYRFCSIEYDRKKHTAKVIWNEVPSVASRSLEVVSGEPEKKKTD